MQVAAFLFCTQEFLQAFFSQLSLLYYVQDSSLAFLWSRMYVIDEIKDYARISCLTFTGKPGHKKVLLLWPQQCHAI